MLCVDRSFLIGRIDDCGVGSVAIYAITISGNLPTFSTASYGHSRFSCFVSFVVSVGLVSLNQNRPGFKCFFGVAAARSVLMAGYR
jgi:hypothetical protein